MYFIPNNVESYVLIKLGFLNSLILIILKYIVCIGTASTSIILSKLIKNYSQNYENK